MEQELHGSGTHSGNALCDTSGGQCLAKADPARIVSSTAGTSDPAQPLSCAAMALHTQDSPVVFAAAASVEVAKPGAS